MAFSIGGAVSIEDISRDSFRLAAREAGLGERMALQRFDAMANRFRSALHESAAELAHDGYVKASALEDRILQSAGIRYADGKA